MTPDDGDRARLADLDRRLAREEPALAAALRQWRLPWPRWPARVAVAVSVVFAVVAVLLGSVGWALLATVTAAAGWWLSRSAPSRPLLPAADTAPPAADR